MPGASEQTYLNLPPAGANKPPELEGVGGSVRQRQEGLCVLAAGGPLKAQRNRLEESGCAGGHGEGA